MGDDIDLVKSGLEAALKPVTDLIEKIAGPAAEEFGLSMRDHVRVFRLKRQIRLFQRVKQMLEAAGTDAKRVPLKFLSPIIEGASVEEDDDLQDQWAALLANASINANLVHPAFSDFLRQLLPIEARFLEFAAKIAKAGREFPGAAQVGQFCKEVTSEDHLQGDEERESENKIVEILSLDTLLRLGLVYRLKENRERYDYQSRLSPETFYRITALGWSFVGACTPPSTTKRRL